MKKLLTLILMLLTLSASAQLPELQGKYVTKISATNATTLREGQWYVMYNRGRKAYNYENPQNGIIYQSSAGLPVGAALTAETAGYLVQLVALGEERPGEYYLLLGTGHWYSRLEQGSQPATAESEERYRGAYAITKIVSGHWALKSEGGYVLDGNGNGSTAVAWGTEIPTTQNGNNDYGFYPVTIGEKSELKGTATVEGLLSPGGVFRFVSGRTSTYSMTDPDNHQLATQGTKAENENQWWIVLPVATGGYTVRNYGSGLFVQATSGDNAQYTTAGAASTIYIKASNKTSTTKANVVMSSASNYDGKTCLHDNSSHKVINYLANNSAGENPASDWELKPIEGVDPELVKNHIDELGGYIAPQGNVIVRIHNASTGRNLSENIDGAIVTQPATDDDYAQYWMLEQVGSAFALRNLKTGHYANVSSGNREVWSTTSSKTANFKITESDDAWQRTYLVSSGNYFMCEATRNQVINFMASDPAARWQFERADISQQEIEKAQMEYEAYQLIKANRSQYSTRMNSFFKDASCSELLDEYQNLQDAELRQQFQRMELPEYLLQIALKVKNNTWGEEDEMSREFRVRDYQVYSSHIYSAQQVGMGYWYGRLTNPTGIAVKAGDILTVFCDKAAPSGTTLNLEVVKGTSGGGDTEELEMGLNIFSFSEPATIFIFYQTSGTTTKVTSCADIKIHLEGGRLNGYYDKTRGHNNETWAHLREHLLKESPVVNIKTQNLVFHMNSELVQKACPKDMEKLLRLWDNMAEQENELMGLNDTYIPEYSQKYRNIYNAFSMTHDYMYATNYGTYYEESTLSTVMSPSGMSGGGLWGPAHENGHLRQNLINMIGTTESSNNLFSNVCVYHQGLTTQRAAAPSTIYDHFAKRTQWYDYDIWETTHMLYQLYLYFHVNGVMPDFFPRFFAKMRSDRMDQTNRTRILGWNEYLKLARNCCEVAQADLSEFFAVYGFFEPCDNRHVGDYGDYYITTTQEDIDMTLDYMHRFPKKLGNILFIEDRVSPVLATYEGHREGETKKRRDDDQLGSGVMAGDVGQYSTYLETPSLIDYYYTVSSTGKVSIKGTGAQGLVGFKVYDENGRMAYVSNKLTFTLPSALRQQQYTLVAAMADGSDITLSTEIPAGIGEVAMDNGQQSTDDGQQTAAGGRSALRDLQGRPVPFPQRGNIYLRGNRKIMY